MNFFKGICILLFFYLLISKQFYILTPESKEINNDNRLIKKEGCLDAAINQY